uniref:Transcriptional regulatory protein n=2 Tax=Phaeomonas parva TaxID=124430 RepID=A0A7S1XKC8_9STRA|mmetsp:Transcript_16226/g.49599  ORF Transcript_16226/g.49599 Transcript_16226/m.49599 type:complete len:297 (+) Transcript_16226:247-1137(+)
MMMTIMMRLVLFAAVLGMAAGFVPGGRGLRAVQASRQQPRTANTVVMMGRRAAKIAARKGKQDALKAKAYARIGKMIIIAVKAGGPDPESNRQLSQVLLEAKGVGVPKDNIKRAIDRASSADAADFKESVFEAYGKGGVGLLINVLSDNANRAATQVKTAIKKGGLTAAASGSVAFNFDRRGRLEVKGLLDEEEVLEVAIEADVDDYEMSTAKNDDDEDITVIFTAPESMSALGSALGEMDGVEGVTPSLVNVPKSLMDCEDEDYDINVAAIDLLLESDDVDSVDHNMNMADTDEE